MSLKPTANNVLYNNKIYLSNKINPYSLTVNYTYYINVEDITNSPELKLSLKLF